MGSARGGYFIPKRRKSKKTRITSLGAGKKKEGKGDPTKEVAPGKEEEEVSGREKGNFVEGCRQIRTTRTYNGTRRK